jgi:hypothetical protein
VLLAETKDMKRKIFYSWQSDRPNATNRSFIEKALELAAKQIASDDTVEVEPVIDRDTSGVPGSPMIAETIFEKVASADVFVADVTLINQPDAPRRTPNPNVLIELGFAMSALGPDRVIMVFNTAYGDIEGLPFDLRQRRVIAYSSAESDESRSSSRNGLAGHLRSQLRLVIQRLSDRERFESKRSILAAVVESISSGRTDRTIVLREFLKSFWAQVHLLGSPPTKTDEELIGKIGEATSIVKGFIQLAEVIAVMDDRTAAREVYRSFGKVVRWYETPDDQTAPYRESDFDIYRFLGHELFVILVSRLIHEERFELLGSLLSEKLMVERRNPDDRSVAFTEIGDYVRLFIERRERLRLVSAHGKQLEALHGRDGELSEIPFEDIVDADFFLFARAQTLNMPYAMWLAPTGIYLRLLPAFLVRADGRERALTIAKALGVDSIEALRELIVRADEILNARFPLYAHLRLTDKSVANIGSR